jgi:twitching motility protein PilT
MENQSGPLSIHRLLAGMKKLNASDLHIKVGVPPTFRIGGLLRIMNAEPISEEEADHLMDPVVPAGLRERFEKTGNIDFATHLKDGDRFRVNMFRAGGHSHVAIRRVKAEIPNYDDLRLPQVYSEVTDKTGEGLVLVVGVTGSGKSSTLAAMIDHINHMRADHIITVEDPVEYRFIPHKSIISQREIGIDVDSYATAMRYIVREDPDVIFIGELRDHDTVLAAVQAAETGHLVFATLHTADTMQTFSRIIEFFPAHEHGFLRHALSNTLKAVFAQRLLPALPETGFGVVPACEVLLGTPTVRDKIREGEDDAIPAIVGRNEEGMQSFTYALAELVKKEWVSLQTALEFAPNRDALQSTLRGVEVKAQGLVNRIRSAGGKSG